MAKKGRKPKEDKKLYFGEREENAVDAYNASDSASEKNKIYESVLRPAFIIMIESIIRRYKLYGPDEEFADTFNDTLSFMISKMGNFRRVITGYWPVPEKDWDKYEFETMDYYVYQEKKTNAAPEDPIFIKVYEKDTHESAKNEEDVVCYSTPAPWGYYKKQTKHFKAYSYCGTVAKNFLIQKINQHQKQIQRNTPYEEVSESLINNIQYSDVNDNSDETTEFIINIADEIKKMTENPERENLTQNELKVGKALVFLFEHWEEILLENGSNKLNKSSVLYFLREDTLLSTKEIRDSMKKYKSIYKIIKQAFLNS